jgi:S-adenosylmethionine:tRNA ribosyltransferase-isomerase
VFGAGSHQIRTEDRAPPPPLTAGDRLSLGPLEAIVERPLRHPRAFQICFFGDRATVLAGLARHGRPIQYAHVSNPLALRDVWTKVAANPVAFEPPSAGFAIEWRTLAAWREQGIHFATLTHATGISSTGDCSLDRQLPFDEPYRIPTQTAAAIGTAKANGGRVIAVGTTVVRALEAASIADGGVRAGDGVASGRILGVTPIRVVDAILTGVHQPGESHFELLRAFVDDAVLDDVTAASSERGYRGHEFGDSVLTSADLGGASACNDLLAIRRPVELLFRRRARLRFRLGPTSTWASRSGLRLKPPLKAARRASCGDG